jgi:hypothetical protein
LDKLDYHTSLAKRLSALVRPLTRRASAMPEGEPTAVI